jgi:hypothetical protein
MWSGECGLEGQGVCAQRKLEHKTLMALLKPLQIVLDDVVGVSVAFLGTCLLAPLQSLAHLRIANLVIIEVRGKMLRRIENPVIGRHGTVVIQTVMHIL